VETQAPARDHDHERGRDHGDDAGTLPQVSVARAAVRAVSARRRRAAARREPRPLSQHGCRTVAARGTLGLENAGFSARHRGPVGRVSATAVSNVDFTRRV
jgi:hypothetical protein